MVMPAPRRPNFVRFILAGAVLGAVVGLWVAVGTPNPQGYAVSDGRGFVMMAFAALGALVAAVIAVVADMVVQRRRG